MTTKTLAERLRDHGTFAGRMADLALIQGLAGTSDWDAVAGGVDIFGVQDAVAEAADALDAKDARIAELEAAIKRQAGATATLRKLDADRYRHLEDKDRSEYWAKDQLDSAKEANAILTAEIDAKDAEIARLRAALEKRDGWQHDMDCGLASGGYCDCGHTEARAALRK